MNVAVVGGGIAGTAAAWALRRSGADVTLVHDRPGATSLYSGALDVEPWEAVAVERAVVPDVLAFAAVFEAWSLGTRGCRVATHEGVLRPARGIDTALLDVLPLGGKTIAVADAPVEGWDGAALARSLAASPLARGGGHRFEAVPVPGFVSEEESRAPWFDIAELHDDEDRLRVLAELLRRARPAADAWLVGPFLGTSPAAAERLRAMLGKPVGETTSRPGGAAGARFDAARDALLSSNGIVVRRATVSALVVGEGQRVHLRASGSEPLGAEAGFDAAILAVGGLVGGGIVLGPAGFRLSIEAPVAVGVDGHAGPPPSLYGVDLTSVGLSGLERVGVLTAHGAVPGTERVFAAGDCVSGRPRTALEAAAAGILVADRALRRAG